MFWLKAYASTVGLPQASTVAGKTDALYDFIVWLSVVLLFGTTAVAVYFIRKYHRSQKGRQTAYILGNHKLELAWTIIPLILMLTIFAWGYKDYLALRAEHRAPIEINVVGRQWLWNFEYANGRKTLNEVYVPKGQPVKLVLTSEDVIHSFFVPNFRLKQDAVPGMYTYLNFVATMEGQHPVYCAEFCGTAHSDMLATIHVLEPAAFQRWLETGKAPATAAGAPQKEQAAPAQAGEPPAEKGRALYMSKACFSCHTLDGTRKIGPSFKGLWGREEKLEGGGTVKVDENYLRQSIVDPNKEVVQGYPKGSMPVFAGQLTDDEINALISFIKTLK